MANKENAPDRMQFNISRRRFVGGVAGLSIYAAVAGCARRDETQPGAPAAGAPDYSAWIDIKSNGDIVIYSAPSEMGQGSMTALPVVIAEELDADWNDVRVEFSAPDDELYANPAFKSMLTIASISVTSYYTAHRLIGAQCRRALMAIAAKEWGVPLEELVTRPSVVVHAPTGKSLSYADISAIADLNAFDAPPVTGEDLKDEKDFRLIGHDVERVDLRPKVDGSAQFAIDVDLPGILYAAIARAPVYGSKPVNIADSRARSEPGVVGVENLGHGVAVIADAPWTAFNAKQLLDITWSEVGPVDRFDSEAGLERFKEAVRAPSSDGWKWEEVGDVEAAFASAPRVFEREYQSDYVYHAQMEPLNAVADVRPESAEVWAGTQAPSFALKYVAQAVGMSPEQVTVHRTLLGGGFGRRAVRHQEYVVDAAVLSQRLKRPVKVMWTREDDLAAGRFKPMSAHQLTGCLDGDGLIVGWRHRVASEEASLMQDPDAESSALHDETATDTAAEVGSPIISMIGTEKKAYGFADRLAEHFVQTTGVRVAPLRGVGATPATFASEQFIDEIALDIGADPFEYRMKLLARSPRGEAVLRKVAEMSQWGRTSPGRAKGIAFSDYQDTFSGVVAEISLDRDTGVIKVHNLWSSVDPRMVVQPDNAIAQTEGGMMFGLSHVLKESIQIRDGKVQNHNFYDYDVLRMAEAPAVHVALTPSGGHPTGVGEMGALLPPAAVANAFAALTGKRLRRMPMTPDRVLSVLNG